MVGQVSGTRYDREALHWGRSRGVEIAEWSKVAEASCFEYLGLPAHCVAKLSLDPSRGIRTIFPIESFRQLDIASARVLVLSGFAFGMCLFLGPSPSSGWVVMLLLLGFQSCSARP